MWKLGSGWNKTRGGGDAEGECRGDTGNHLGTHKHSALSIGHSAFYIWHLLRLCYNPPRK